MVELQILIAATLNALALITRSNSYLRGLGNISSALHGNWIISKVNYAVPATALMPACDLIDESFL